jgi:hypothetical protein
MLFFFLCCGIRNFTGLKKFYPLVYGEIRQEYYCSAWKYELRSSLFAGGEFFS